MKMVWVTNTGSDFLQGSWDGEIFKFPPQTPVQVPVEVARATFGYQIDDKAPFLARLGWIRTSNDVPEGLARLAAVVISEDLPQNRRSVSPATVGASPTVRQRAVGEVKTLNAAR
jgi:hypothetical protein